MQSRKGSEFLFISAPSLYLSLWSGGAAEGYSLSMSLYFFLNMDTWSLNRTGSSLIWEWTRGMVPNQLANLFMQVWRWAKWSGSAQRDARELCERGPTKLIMINYSQKCHKKFKFQMSNLSLNGKTWQKHESLFNSKHQKKNADFYNSKTDVVNRRYQNVWDKIKIFIQTVSAKNGLLFGKRISFVSE